MSIQHIFSLKLIKYGAAAVLALVVLAALISYSVRDEPSYSKEDGEIVLVPHQALYEIKTRSVKSGASISNLKGQMFYEFYDDQCQGWLTSHRFNLHYDVVDQPSFKITSEFETYEKLDGAEFSFLSNRERNGEVIEAFNGYVEDGVVSYEQQDLKHVLPDDVLFPVQHTREVLRHINEGNKFYSATIFDGSGLEGATLINTFLGGLVPKGQLSHQEIEGGSVLEAVTAYKVRLAFFPFHLETENPEYEMDMVFHDNGVIREMTLHYEDFSISQKLVSLELLEQRCDDHSHVH